jgi:ubiquinone/menaquinone biosynthesis C-methylase UbiE
MAQIVGSSEPAFVLDIGCGGRELLGILAEKFPRSECVGIDLRVETGIATETNLCDSPNMQFLRADCNYLPLRSHSAELAFSASMLEHIPNLQQAVSELERVLQPGGTLVVGVPTENRVYRLARKAARLRKPIDHFHQSDHVEAVLDSRFARNRMRKLPSSVLPSFLSLYQIVVYSGRLDSCMPHPSALEECLSN